MNIEQNNHWKEFEIKHNLKYTEIELKEIGRRMKSQGYSAD